MAINGKKITTIKMGQGKLRMIYPTWVNPNTKKPVMYSSTLLPS